MGFYDIAYRSDWQRKVKKRKRRLPQKFDAEKEFFEEWRFKIRHKQTYFRKMKQKPMERPLPTADFVYHDYRHLLIGEDPKKMSAKYECTCGESFNQRNLFRIHIAPKFQCVYCPLEFLDKDTYDGHRFFDHATH